MKKIFLLLPMVMAGLTLSFTVESHAASATAGQVQANSKIYGAGLEQFPAAASAVLDQFKQKLFSGKKPDAKTIMTFVAAFQARFPGADFSKITPELVSLVQTSYATLSSIVQKDAKGKPTDKNIATTYEVIVSMLRLFPPIAQALKDKANQIAAPANKAAALDFIKGGVPIPVGADGNVDTRAYIGNTLYAMIPLMRAMVELFVSGTQTTKPEDQALEQKFNVILKALLEAYLNIEVQKAMADIKVNSSASTDNVGLAVMAMGLRNKTIEAYNATH